MKPTTDPTEFETASVRERVAAYLLDLLVVGAVVASASRLAGSVRERVRLGGLLGVVVANAYHVVLEGSGGQTVGKRIVGVAVVADDGGPCGYGAAATRTAFRVVDWLPVGYLLGLVAIAVTERRQRAGDRAANTVVVRTGSESNGRD